MIISNQSTLKRTQIKKYHVTSPIIYTFLHQEDCPQKVLKSYFIWLHAFFMSLHGATVQNLTFNVLLIYPNF